MHDGFEWMNGRWWYEGIGFTWFGRLESNPAVTAGLEIFFEELPAATSGRILTSLGLRLAPGMRLTDIRASLGEPVETDIFVSDRKTYSFVVGKHSRYRIGCTVHKRRGLLHVSMLRQDVFEKLLAA